MTIWEVDIYIEDVYQGLVEESRLREAVERVFKAHGARPAQVSLAILGDEEVRRLNKAYRGRDEVTDVLSFPLAGGDFPSVPEALPLLGEVVVAYPQAERQAEEQGHPVGQELCLLMVHGVLHLLGYDHEGEAEAELMRQAEARALAGACPERLPSNEVKGSRREAS